ncbi:ParB/RepB/Spo0J family partition protein [Anaerosphaera multitolerans]|uniref:ParB/RepB/Spo0J family partition protein n=1 Tax=Anaerosphaera multitolerans TaxID=2487351 RepID=A0A437S9F3_9FIRM|nr:ParB/RepB/Spo0J family partition protein [Anaerosphaera multitolerans]RVU55753.1 ParB/RepB/Spo0J family partition protein [Anaerosphaera multitolerans]
MAKKTGLGRGINNFIKDTQAVEKILNQESDQGLQKISMDLIEVNENQARKYFDETALEELSDSIREYGVIQPILLRKMGKKYLIIAGERRYRAATMAGLTEIPAVVKEIDSEEADKISLIENVQRKDLNPIEEALGYKKVIDEYSLTQEELAKALGKSRQYIGNTIRLLKLDSRVVDLLLNNSLSVSHGKLLLSIKDGDKQFKEAMRIVNSGSTVKETTKIFEREKKPERTDVFKEKVRRELSDILGTKVNFKEKGRTKKIEIEYYSDEDLSRIYETILRSE